MEASQAKARITPTLQANWNLAISDIIKALNSALINEAWLACETLYLLLPPDEMLKTPDIEHHYKSIKKELESNVPESVAYESQVLSYNGSIEVLRREVKPFFRKMYVMLYKGGHLKQPENQVPQGQELTI